MSTVVRQIRTMGIAAQSCETEYQTAVAVQLLRRCQWDDGPAADRFRRGHGYRVAAALVKDAMNRSSNGCTARTCRLRGTVEYRDEADALLAAPGDAALVHRGVLRSLVMRCPDGCGETLVVNLDRRAGKAWRIDQRGGGPTIYPSVWRDGGCESHFIVWKGHILWCDRFEDENVEPFYDEQIEPRVLARLDVSTYRSAEEIAYSLGETPGTLRAYCVSYPQAAGPRSAPGSFATTTVY